MKHKKIIIIISVIILIGVASFLMIKFFQKPDLPSVDEENLRVFMDEEYYIGNSYNPLNPSSTFNIRDILSYEQDVTVKSLNDSYATINGSEITVLNTGILKLEITDGKGDKKERELTIVDGVNVTDFRELYLAVALKKTAVIHRDIELVRAKDTDYRQQDYLYGNNLHLGADLYGNGHKIWCEKVMDNTFAYAFSACKDNVMVRDAHFIGKRMQANDSLTSLDKAGIIFRISEEQTERISGTQVLNCIFENAVRHIFVSNTDISVKGTIFRNSSDACLSIETTPRGASHVTIEDCVMSNPLVAAITIWCKDNINDSADFVTLDIKGFLDIYNWKSTDTARIVPNFEKSEYIVTPIIKTELEKTDYDDLLYHYNGNKYVHLALLVMSTSKTGNKPTVTGLDSLNYKRRDFPMPSAAKIFITTCEFYGYESNPAIQPDSKLSDNSNLYYDLKYGRD